MKKITFILFVALTMQFGCIDNESIKPSDTIKLNWVESQTVQIEGDYEGAPKLLARLVLPGSTPSKIPAVVIMHGSGGMWVDNVPDGEMAKQFRDWADSLSHQNIAALFIDSYSPRGIDEFAEVPPPDNQVVAAEFVRPLDANAALNFLRKLQNPDGSMAIIPDKILLLGFSHGGSSTLATVVDTEFDQIKETTNWTQRYNGEEYEVPAPCPKPESGGFVGAIAYYPGCGFYSYFKGDGGINSKYRPYTNTLIIAADNDPLFTGGYTESLVNFANTNGAGDNNKSIELVVVSDANHGFDGKSSGTDGIANTYARRIAMGRIKELLLPR